MHHRSPCPLHRLNHSKKNCRSKICQLNNVYFVHKTFVRVCCETCSDFFRQKQRSEKWGRLYCVDSVDKGDNALYQLHTENICVDKRWQRLTLSAFSENAVAKRWHFYYISSLILKRYIIVYQRLYRWYFSVSTCQPMAPPKCVYPVCNAKIFLTTRFRGNIGGVALYRPLFLCQQPDYV